MMYATNQCLTAVNTSYTLLASLADRQYEHYIHKECHLTD